MFLPPQIHQFDYLATLYKHELLHHNRALDEYDLEICDSFTAAVDAARPNIDLYKQQPYLTFAIRGKLIDFLLKMSIRLKILPFVFYRAVRIFDRYCLKRIVLLDQSQLIITTCLWIAAKLQGGNNHFINLGNLDKMLQVKTILDLGYGSGGKYKGPTERFRLPKLHELVKLCGAKCKYDQGMFKQMELHVLATLDWSFNDPLVEEFVVYLHEFSVLKENEFFKIKEFLAYVLLYQPELIDVSVIETGKVLLDVVNEALDMDENNYFYQRLNYSEDVVMDAARYRHIKKHLVKAVLNASEFALKLFASKGPQQLVHAIHTKYGDATAPAIPAPHQMLLLYTFQSPAATPTKNQHIYRPVALPTQKADLPHIVTSHPHPYAYRQQQQQHNHSALQTSLNLLVLLLKDHDMNLIFEYDPRRYGISTPLLDDELPKLPLVKPRAIEHSC